MGVSVHDNMTTSMTWTTYVIRLNSGRKEEIVHYNYLKPYHVRPEQVQKPKTKPRNLPKEEPLSESSDDSEFETRNNNDRRYPEEDHLIDIHAIKKGVV